MKYYLNLTLSVIAAVVVSMPMVAELYKVVKWTDAISQMPEEQREEAQEQMRGDIGKDFLVAVLVLGASGFVMLPLMMKRIFE